MICVVGSGLAGLTAAARLQASGGSVLILEAEPAAPRDGPATEPGGRVVTDLSSWSELFAATGEELDQALARVGLRLEAAPPRTRLFTDAGRMDLDGTIDEQWAQAAHALGPETATIWSRLLESLRDTHRIVISIAGRIARQPLPLSAAERRALQTNRSIADLAAATDSPQLAQIVLDVAAWLGQDPRRLPAWHAHRLWLETTGRWQVVDGTGRPQPATILVEALWDRLHELGVAFHAGEEVTAIRRGPIVSSTAGTLRPQAVISTVDPFTHADLTRERGDQKLTTRLQSAPTGGPRWRDWRTLLDLPPLEPSLPRVVVASAWSPAGIDSWAQLATGALAATSLSADLGLRPTL